MILQWKTAPNIICSFEKREKVVCVLEPIGMTLSAEQNLIYRSYKIRPKMTLMELIAEALSCFHFLIFALNEVKRSIICFFVINHQID